MTGCDPRVEHDDRRGILVGFLEREVGKVLGRDVFEQLEITERLGCEFDFVNAVCGGTKCVELRTGHANKEVDLLGADELVELVVHAEPVKLPRYLRAASGRVRERISVAATAPDLEPIGAIFGELIGTKPTAAEIFEFRQPDATYRSDRLLFVPVGSYRAVFLGLGLDFRVVGERVELLSQVLEIRIRDVEDHRSSV